MPGRRRAKHLGPENGGPFTLGLLLPSGETAKWSGLSFLAFDNDSSS